MAKRMAARMGVNRVTDLVINIHNDCCVVRFSLLMAPNNDTLSKTALLLWFATVQTTPNAEEMLWSRREADHRYQFDIQVAQNGSQANQEGRQPLWQPL